MDSFVNDTADAFANLATATALDRQLMADLAATNKALTKQLADRDTTIAKLRNNNDRNNTGNDRNRNRQPQTTRRYNNSNYCWSHGFDIHDSHTGQSCCWQKEGHKADATRSNTMGGSELNKQLVA